MRQRLKGKAVAPKEQIDNPATPTPTGYVQKPSRRELFRSIFPGTSKSPHPVDSTQNDTTTSSMFTTSKPPVPPIQRPDEGSDAEGNSTTAATTNSPSTGPLKLGKLLQQEASDLWTKAYNDLPIEYKQDLDCVGNTDDGKPEKLEGLLELAMKAKRKNFESQWKLQWGGKEINVREKAEKLVGWIERFKEVVNIAVQYDPVHATLPWAGVRFILILVTSEQQNLQHAIIAMERITFLISRCTIYEKLYLINCEAVEASATVKTATDELRRALVILYTAILRALSRWNFLANLRFSDATFAEITALDAPELVVNSAVQTVENCYNSSTHQQNQETFDRLTILLRDFSSVVTVVHEWIQETERIAILKWFSVIPYQGHHDLASESRVAGTGQWLFQREEFRHWQQSARSEILWLHGIPGSGKTKLVSATIDHLRERKVIFFYCSQDEEPRRDRHTILLSFIKQLACPPDETCPPNETRPPNKIAIYTEAFQAYKNEQKDPGARQKLPVDMCLKLLSRLLEYYKHPVIFLDAPDESSKESCRLILSDLLSIVEKSKHLVKVFISTRHSLEIKACLKNPPHVSIEAKDNAQDIENYVKSTLSKRKEDRELLREDALRQRIEEVLLRDAKGMFLWVHHQLRELCSLDFEHDIRAQLGKLPKDLTGVYNKIMDSLMQQPGSNSKIATRVLKWMAVSRRPLVPDELIIAAQLDPDRAALTPKLNLRIDRLIQLCEGLISWDKQLNVIRFSHVSVKEYLGTESMNKYWDITNAHHLVMEACLSILQYLHPPDVPLYPYTALHWFHHCRSYQDLVVQATAINKPPKHTLDIQSLRNFLPSFNEPTASYKKWVQSLSTYSDTAEWGLFEDLWLKDHPLYPAFTAALGGLGGLANWLWLAEGVDIDVTDARGTPLLHYAIVSSSAELVKRMITMGVNINTNSGEGQTALGCAITIHNVELVSMLLEHGADINAGCGMDDTVQRIAAFRGRTKVKKDSKPKQTNGDSMTALSLPGFDVEIFQFLKLGPLTPLQLAASNGHDTDIVELLLEKGAPIEAINHLGFTPLHFAAVGGHTGIVELLLGKGALTEAIGTSLFLTPLHFAAMQGHTGTVQLLLEKGALIEAVDKNGSSPLQLAALMSHNGIVKLLLEKGASIETRDRDNNTPLHTVAWNGQIDIVELLLEKGALIGAVDDDHNTPLHLAAWNSHIGTVKLLLEKGAPTEAMNVDNNTPVHYAAHNGHTDTVEVLLGEGALIGAMNVDSNTPLHYAAHYGHSGTVKLLLGRGALIGAMNADSDTPLHFAVLNGHSSTVELLLGKGASIEATGKNGSTPLHQAAWRGHTGTVELLLGKGALIEAITKDNKTPLHIAVCKGHTRMVELLLEKGALIETKSTSLFLTPLHVATMEGHTGIVELLLEKGALIEAVDQHGYSSLHLAAMRCHTGTVELLIEKGALIEAVDKHGCTSLHLAAMQGHTGTVELLLEKGALIEAADKNGCTPLHHAALMSRTGTVKLLLEKGASY